MRSASDRFAVALVGSALAALASPIGLSTAYGQQLCPVPPGGSPSLAQEDAGARLRFIRQRMQHAAHRARIWSWTFGLTYTALTVVNASLAPVFSPPDRTDYIVGTATSAIGVATLVFMPMRVLGDQHRLEARVNDPLRATERPGARALGGNPCALLAEAETLLLRDAADQAFGKSLLIHFAGALFNVGVGALLGFAFNRWNTATIDMMAGVAVSEIMTASKPDDLVDDLARYRQGLLTPPHRAPGAGWLGGWALAPSLSGTNHGLALGRSF